MCFDLIFGKAENLFIATHTFLNWKITEPKSLLSGISPHTLRIHMWKGKEEEWIVNSYASIVYKIIENKATQIWECGIHKFI